MSEAAVTKVRMGQGVPEWLLAIEPMGPQANRGAFRFAVDVDIIDTPDFFVVVPTMAGSYPGILDMQDTHGCKVLAASKLVRFALVQDCVFEETVGPYAVAPFAQSISPGLRPADMLGSPPTKPGLLARLLRAWRG